MVSFMGMVSIRVPGTNRLLTTLDINLTDSQCVHVLKMLSWTFDF